MGKHITLQKLRLENFKGISFLELEPLGRSGCIRGDNASGKSTVYDGLTWLLFGKDSRGQKDFDIKPLDRDGNVADHSAITAVEGEFLVDGVPLKLRRTYYEVWSTKRGSADKSFDGHSSDYAVDEVPMKKGAFDQRVKELVDEELFRLLTNVFWFPEGLSWQKRRETLFDLAGVHSDREIMATDDRFSPLAQAMGHMELEDLRRKLKAERGSLNTRRSGIPDRIAENNEKIRQLSDLDYDGMEEHRGLLSGKKSELERQILQAKEAGNAEPLRRELQAAQSQLKALEAENRAHRASQQRPDRAGELRRELERKQLTLRSCQTRARNWEADILGYQQRIAQCREAWSWANSRVFTPGSCPTCGQSLPQTAQERAKREFEARVASDKERAIQDSQMAKEQLEKAQQRLNGENREAEELASAIGALEMQLAAEAAQEAPEPEDMPEYALRRGELMAQCDSLSSRLYSLESDSAAATAQLRGAVRDLEHEIHFLDRQLAQKGLLEDLHRRVEELEEQARGAAEAMNGIDRMIALCEEYTRYKVGFVEDTVNSMFRLATFRLYREQQNGGLEDRCDVVCAGVPYGSLNNGARINVGLDIINTISAHHGVRVPLFIDNAESVTRLTDTQAQVIRLKVDERCQKLEVSYED